LILHGEGGLRLPIFLKERGVTIQIRELRMTGKEEEIRDLRSITNPGNICYEEKTAFKGGERTTQLREKEVAGGRC